MTDKFTEMVFILDRSGSMSGLEGDTIGGFNSMIDRQRGDGDAVVTTVLFSDDMEILHDRVRIEDVPKLTAKEYYVTSTTALLDAVGVTIERIRRLQSSPSERPRDATLFVIVTDGQENASREYTYEKVKGLIEGQKEKGWDFLFLGANIDVAREAGRMGIGRANAVEYCCDSAGIKDMYQEIGCRIECAKEKGSFRAPSAGGPRSAAPG